MASLFPVPPLIPPLNPTGAAKKAGDVAVKDEKVRASTLIAQETGWRGNDARIARAVMGGESGYNTHAANYCCHGLMQVNVLAHAGKFGLPADKDKAAKVMEDDPRFNLRVAYKIFQAQGWDAWEAYTNGSWKKFVGQDPVITVNKNSIQESVGGAVGDAVDAVTAPFDAVGDIVNALFSPSAWLRLGKGALGGGLVILGTGALVFIVANRAASSPAGQAAGKAAVKAAAVVK